MAIVSALVFLLADGVASLYVGRILSGLCVGVGAGTGTAWLAELIAEKGNARATMIATVSNFLGLGIAALAAGLLAQYAPWPLRLPFLIYLAALLIGSLPIWRTQETISQPAENLREVPLRPRIALPRAIRIKFVAPVVTGFGTMALVGFYAALAPSILAENLHATSHAVAGALFFELACGHDDHRAHAGAFKPRCHAGRACADAAQRRPGGDGAGARLDGNHAHGHHLVRGNCRARISRQPAGRK